MSRCEGCGCSTAAVLCRACIDRFMLMILATDQELLCEVCRSPITSVPPVRIPPRLQKIITKMEPTAVLCWVCARLHNSAAREDVYRGFSEVL